LHGTSREVVAAEMIADLQEKGIHLAEILSAIGMNVEHMQRAAGELLANTQMEIEDKIRRLESFGSALEEVKGLGLPEGMLQKLELSRRNELAVQRNASTVVGRYLKSVAPVFRKAHNPLKQNPPRRLAKLLLQRLGVRERPYKR